MIRFAMNSPLHLRAALHPSAALRPVGCFRRTAASISKRSAVATRCSNDDSSSSKADAEIGDASSSKPFVHPEMTENEVDNTEALNFTAPAHWRHLYLSQSASMDLPSIEDSWDLSDTFIPPPANLPTSEDAVLYAPRRDLWTLTDQPGIDLLLAGPSAVAQLRQVYVILFGVGERDTEGIYSLRAFSDDGLPQETIIVFETEEDAQRYAGLLEATMDHTPNVCSIPPRELIDFCVDQGYNCRLEPRGSLLIPPDYNVGVTDWERSMRLRDGRFVVLDSEPEQLSFGRHAGGAGTQVANLQAHPGVNSSTLARYTSFSDAELQNIKAKLEKLLPSE